MQSDSRTEQQANTAALLGNLKVELFFTVANPQVEESLKVAEGKKMDQALAQNQKAYQALIERLIDRITRFTPSSTEELLRITAQEMGARAYGVVRATSSTSLEIEVVWPEQSIDWSILEEVLLRYPTIGKNRSELVLIPEEFQKEFGSRNLLLSRLSKHPEDPDWLRALVFIGRERPPVEGASRGFLTRDFPIIEIVADWYRKEEAGVEEIPAAHQPLWRAMSLRDSLVHRLGPRVTLTIGDGELIISGVTLQKELRDLATQAMVEICIILLFGWEIYEQISLEEGAFLPTPRGTVDEFRVVVQEFPVYGRKISVRQLPGGTETEIILPTGWWWTVEPQGSKVSRDKAIDTALEEEKSKQPEVTDLTANLVETVLWPDNPPGRIAHQVQVYSERGLGPTYFIDAHDGSIITRRQTIRSWQLLHNIHQGEEPNMVRLAKYLFGYRTAPLLKVKPGMGGAKRTGIKDFLRFLLGYRGYIKVDVNEYE